MENKKGVNVIRVVIMLLLVLLVIPLLPILISGRWNWWEAWVMTAIFILTFIISRALAVRRSPDILTERANYNLHENTQPWDKWLSPLVAFGSVFILLAAGLDALYHWSAGFPLVVEIAGLALIVSGYFLGSYAFIENAFFSGTVRIQEERGHKVVSSGPYAWVRHPGYLGSLVASLGMPLLLELGLVIHHGCGIWRHFLYPYRHGRPLFAGKPAGIPGVRTKGTLPAAARGLVI